MLLNYKSSGDIFNPTELLRIIYALGLIHGPRELIDKAVPPYEPATAKGINILIKYLKKAGIKEI